MWLSECEYLLATNVNEGDVALSQSTYLVGRCTLTSAQGD